MKGPYPFGTFGCLDRDLTWELSHGLLRGNWYRVVREFTDSSGFAHRLNEEWEFMGSTFVPYDSEYIFVVRCASGSEWSIGFHDNSASQLAVRDDIGTYIQPSTGASM